MDIGRTIYAMSIAWLAVSGAVAQTKTFDRFAASLDGDLRISHAKPFIDMEGTLKGKKVEFPADIDGPFTMTSSTRTSWDCMMQQLTRTLALNGIEVRETADTIEVRRRTPAAGEGVFVVHVTSTKRSSVTEVTGVVTPLLSNDGIVQRCEADGALAIIDRPDSIARVRAALKETDNDLNRSASARNKAPGFPNAILRPMAIFTGGILRGYLVYPAEDRAAFACMGFEEGDLVTAINGVPLGNMRNGEMQSKALRDMMESLKTKSPTSLKLTLIRDGKEIVLEPRCQL